MTIPKPPRFNEAPSWFSGKSRERIVGRAGDVASMRPRVGSRGSRRGGCGATTNSIRFNEAPSWFSGKYEIIQLLARALVGFNEAPSWFSGK